jgi:hypothetical protein
MYSSPLLAQFTIFESNGIRPKKGVFVAAAVPKLPPVVNKSRVPAVGKHQSGHVFYQCKDFHNSSGQIQL